MSPIRVVLGFLVLGLVFLPGPVSSQDVSCPQPEAGSGTAVVVGRVVESETGIPLGFAIVRVLVPGRQAPLEGRANRSGEFQFCSVPQGRISVSAQLGQLGAVFGPVTLEAGQVFQTELKLEPATEARFSGTVAGVVLEAGTSEPIDGAAVTLLDLGQSTVTNEFGRFVFPSLPPGITGIQVNRLGYAEVVEDIEVQIGRVVDTRIILSTEPIALPPIEVTAVRRRIELPGLEDFERRYHSGWGRFILEEEIQNRAPHLLAQMLVDVPGVEVSDGWKRIRFRRMNCAPLVYVDGVNLTHLPRGGGPSRPSGEPGGEKSMYLWPDPSGSPTAEAADAVNLIHPSEVKAVEIYRGPSEIPGQYLDSNARCGIILIWTRRGDISGS